MNWLDSYLDQMRPAMERIGERCDHFAGRVLDQLEGIRRAVETDPVSMFRRWPQSGVSNAAGLADLVYEVPLDKSVRLISAACSGVAPTATTGCAVYLGDADNEANLLHVFSYGQRFSDGFPEGAYVGAGEKIIIRFVAQGAAQRVTANLNVSLLHPAKVPNAPGAGQPFDAPGLFGQETEEIERHFPDITGQPVGGN